MYYDSQSAIHLAKNSTCHLKSKHIDVSLDTRRAWQETIVDWKDSHNREQIRYDDKVIAQWNVEKLYAKSELSGAPHMV